MVVTSETLFHFTKTRKNLESILEQKFKVTYCKENIQMNNKPAGDLHFPMICFCDLPLALIKDHITKYGSYAIGMTKDWGIKNKLNPVLYLEQNSFITNDMYQQFDNIDSILTNLDEIINKDTVSNNNIGVKFKSLISSFKKNYDFQMNLYRYIKNYEGVLIRDKKYKNYRFYDEREWRFVPEYNSKDVKNRLNSEEYLEYRNTGKNKKLLEKPILDFTSNDIKYLVVKSEKDITPLIRKIKSINHLCLTGEQSDILVTKILTIESLNSDF